MLRKASQILALTIVLAAFCCGQEDIETAFDQDAKNPIKVDEFGMVGGCDLNARIGNFFVELNNDPTATGYIIVYQGKDVLPADYESAPMERRIRQEIRFSKFDESRIVFIKGGFRQQMSNELWLVRAGADAPVPTDTVSEPTLPKGKTYLYDSNNVGYAYDGAEDFLTDFILPSVQAAIDEQNRLAEEEWKRDNPEIVETGEITVEENTEETTKQPAAESIEESTAEEIRAEQPTQEEIDEIKFSWANGKFGEIIKKQKGATGVIIFYADDAYYDTNKLQNFIDDGRNRIAAESKVSPDKIQVIFGGFRNSVEADFWVVPKKGEFPTPTPEQREVENTESEENK